MRLYLFCGKMPEYNDIEKKVFIVTSIGMIDHQCNNTIMQLPILIEYDQELEMEMVR